MVTLAATAWFTPIAHAGGSEPSGVAAWVRSCGSRGIVIDLSVRNTSCSTGFRVARSAYRRGWRCRWLGANPRRGISQHRCTRGRMAIRFWMPGGFD
jgi:hypothetical protein